MKFKSAILITLIGTLFVSCDSSKLKKEAKAKTTTFFSFVKSENFKQLITLYPKIKELSTYYKSDSAKITSVNSNNNTVTISVDSWYTVKGNTNKRKISLYFQKDSTGQLKIVDSKGLIGFFHSKTYVFGCKTGYLDTLKDTTDVQIYKALNKSASILSNKIAVFITDLKQHITFESNWARIYRGAFGLAILTNNSKFSVSNLKCEIDYQDKQGRITASRIGNISSGIVRPGKKKPFSFAFHDIGNASTVSIIPLFDTTAITDYLIQQNGKGTESMNTSNFIVTD